MESTRARPHVRGFTLIEVMVTVFIVTMIIVMYIALSSTLALTRGARYQAMALHIASGEMNTLRSSGYNALPPSGNFSDPGLSNLPSGTSTLTVSSLNATTKQIVVTVSWQDKRARSLSLTTYITQTGGL